MSIGDKNLKELYYGSSGEVVFYKFVIRKGGYYKENILKVNIGINFLETVV